MKQRSRTEVLVEVNEEAGYPVQDFGHGMGIHGLYFAGVDLVDEKGQIVYRK